MGQSLILSPKQIRIVSFAMETGCWIGFKCFSGLAGGLRLRRSGLSRPTLFAR